MNLSLYEISKIFRFVPNFEDKIVNKIKIDSRKVSNNDVFVAIKGENFDGNDFVYDALNRGASLVISERIFNDNDKVVTVDDSIESLQKIAKFYKNKFKIRTIGITGSVGKSTVKEMVSSIFERVLNVVKTEANFNGQIGVPLTLFNLNEDTDVAVIEMGISKIGEMDKLVDIVDPDFAIINNIGVSHLQNFLNLDNTCTEKLKIGKNPKCILFINGDNPDLVEFSKNMENDKIYFGLNGNFKYVAKNISVSNNALNFVLQTASLVDDIKILYSGIHNVYNALSAISLSIEFGLHIEDIKKGLMNFKLLPMRQQIINTRNIIILDDSYNSSPDSVKASMNFFDSINCDGKSIVILGDILELGDYSRSIHFDLGKYISSYKIDFLFTVGKESRHICEGLNSVNKNVFTKHFESNSEICEEILNILKDGDKILIKGSRAMHMEMIVNRITDVFSEYKS